MTLRRHRTLGKRYPSTSRGKSRDDGTRVVYPVSRLAKPLVVWNNGVPRTGLALAQGSVYLSGDEARENSSHRTTTALSAHSSLPPSLVSNSTKPQALGRISRRVFRISGESQECENCSSRTIIGQPLVQESRDYQARLKINEDGYIQREFADSHCDVTRLKVK